MSGGEQPQPPVRNDATRRRAARRFNERVKLFATFLNNVGIAILAGAVIVPWANAQAEFHWVRLSVPVVLHLVAQAALSLLRSED